MPNDAVNLLIEESKKTGWNESSMLEIACQYIDNQKDYPTFKDFVRRKADEEMDVGVGVDE
jgi:hypothetical protein